MGFIGGLSLGQKILGGFGMVALLAGAIWLYGHLQYREGVRDTDDRWEEAGRRLEEQAEQAAGDAGKRADDRLAEHNDRLLAERRCIDEVVEWGDSPLDVLFPGADDSVHETACPDGSDAG